MARRYGSAASASLARMRRWRRSTRWQVRPPNEQNGRIGQRTAGSWVSYLFEKCNRDLVKRFRLSPRQCVSTPIDPSCARIGDEPNKLFRKIAWRQDIVV